MISSEKEKICHSQPFCMIPSYCFFAFFHLVIFCCCFIFFSLFLNTLLYFFWTGCIFFLFVVDSYEANKHFVNRLLNAYCLVTHCLLYLHRITPAISPEFIVFCCTSYPISEHTVLNMLMIIVAMRKKIFN